MWAASREGKQCQQRMSRDLSASLLAGLPASAQDASKGEAVFKRCRACHAIGPAAQNKAGPALTGIVGTQGRHRPWFQLLGRHEGRGPGGIVWTEPTLEQFLESPDAFVPNNVMASPGIKNPSDLQDLVAFLKLHK